MLWHAHGTVSCLNRLLFAKPTTEPDSLRGEGYYEDFRIAESKNALSDQNDIPRVHTQASWVSLEDRTKIKDLGALLAVDDSRIRLTFPRVPN